MTKLNLDDTNIHDFFRDIAALARIARSFEALIGDRRQQPLISDECIMDELATVFGLALSKYLVSQKSQLSVSQTHECGMKPVSLECSKSEQSFSPHLSH